MAETYFDHDGASSKIGTRKVSFCVVLVAEWCCLLGIIGFISVLVILVPSSSEPKSYYETWCIGACNTDVVTSSQPGAILMGGGTDTDEAFDWHIRHANRGDFLVMRASGDDGYNRYIYDMAVDIGFPLNSVRTILFKDAKASSNDNVLQYIRNAEAIFFAGGDQSVYIAYWMGTEVQSLIQSKLFNVTVGGTSAGLAILGEWIYTGEDGSAVSDDAMMNPYNQYMDFADTFLSIPFLNGVITDTHFVARDRMGRMLSFVARLWTDVVSPTPHIVHSIGVDEHTALLLDVHTGIAVTVGVGTAYVCSASMPPGVCQPNTPLTFHDVVCVRLSADDSDTFSFASFVSSGMPYTNNITMGILSDNPYGPLT